MKTMKASSSLIIIVSVIVIFGGIKLSDGLGLWQTESSKVPVTYAEGDYAGQYNPADIRGSYTFLDIENSFGVKPELLARAFNITSDIPEQIQAKDLEALYHFEDEREIGTASIRFFVALYKGLPYEGMNWLPNTAVDVLVEEGLIDDVTLDNLESYIIIVEEVSLASPPTGDGQESEATQEESHVEVIAVRGKTTIQDLLDYGITEEEYTEILGVSVSNKNMLVKDVCSSEGLAFSEIKAKLNNLLE